MSDDEKVIPPESCVRPMAVTSDNIHHRVILTEVDKCQKGLIIRTENRLDFKIGVVVRASNDEMVPGDRVIFDAKSGGDLSGCPKCGEGNVIIPYKDIVVVLEEGKRE